MAKKLGWNTNPTINDLVINHEDDIFKDFPFLKLVENGLSMKSLDDLTVPDDNRVRGLVKSRFHKLDGLSAGKVEGLTGSLTYGWDRTSWPIPYIRVNGKNQIFDRRHTFFVCRDLNTECKNIAQVPTAEYVRVESELGGIINKFQDISILMMASMWGNVYGPTVDDTTHAQFQAVIVRILRQEKEFLGLKPSKIFTRDIIRNLFRYMGGEDRYAKSKATQTRVISGALKELTGVETVNTSESCINSNIDALNNYIDESDDWLPNNKEDDVTKYWTKMISKNTWHMSDIVRQLTMTVCKEDLNKGPKAKTTKVILYNDKESNKSDDIRRSRAEFEKQFQEMFETIRDSVLLPVEKVLNKDIIPRKELSDYKLEVYAMNQIEGEEEPFRLL